MSPESFVQKIDMVLNDLTELFYVYAKLRQIEGDRVGERCSLLETGDGKLDQVSVLEMESCSLILENL